MEMLLKKGEAVAIFDLVQRFTIENVPFFPGDIVDKASIENAIQKVNPDHLLRHTFLELILERSDCRLSHRLSYPRSPEPGYLHQSQRPWNTSRH